MKLPALICFVLAACGDEPVPAPPLRHLEHPGDVAFGQVGGRLTAYVLEPARGDVVVVSNPGLGEFVDADPYAPGSNGLAVGRLPVAIATSTDGRFAVTANAGSCDLSLIDVVKAEVPGSDAVSARPLSTSAGPLLARPTMIATRSSGDTFGEPSNQAYVAFAGCHLVARVDLATGAVLDGVQMLPGYAPALVGADVSCPAECGAPGPEPPLAASSLMLEPDGSRLYAGFAGDGAVLIVDLDAKGRAAAATLTTLEGAGGIARLASTGPVEMGNRGIDTFHFVYAIGTDSAIHVVDVTPGRTPRECDTQIDRRYLHDLTTSARLACFPVGDPANPPRRAGVAGPGIRLPEGALPLDVAFVTGGAGLAPGQPPSPSALSGTFALVTATGPITDERLGHGLVYVINVDDDNYADLEDDGFIDELGDIGLAIPHALRDGSLRRSVGPFGCVDPGPLFGDVGPPRLSDETRDSGFDYAFTPGLHHVMCDEFHAPSELALSAPREVRAQLFADLERTAVRSPSAPADEAIRVQWEGTFTLDAARSQRSGGRLTPLDGARLDLQAAGAGLCSLGVQDGDLLRLVGCNADSDCGSAEKCLEHKDAPAGVNGLCVPAARAGALSATCRELLVSSRRFTLGDVRDDHAVLTPRIATLPATPIAGCESAEQCAAIESAIAVRAGGTAKRHQLACEVDPAAGGAPRCLLACAGDADCDPGSVCVGARCVLAPVAPAECLAAPQRYELRGGDAFIVASSTGSFGHRVKADPASGRCVMDERASPLMANRIRRAEPECTDLSVKATAPNPCRIPDLQEPYREGTDLVFSRRPAYGMRLRSPGMSFDLTDVAYPLSEVGDVMVSHIPSGFSLRFTLAGGFSPFAQALYAARPERVRVAPDGAAFVVDSGDLFGGLIQGQVLFVIGSAVQDHRLR